MNRKISFTIALILCFIIGFAVSVPGAAFAEPNVTDWIEDKKPSTEQPAAVAEAQEDQSLFGIIAKLILYTLLILAMIYGLIKFLSLRQRKFQPNQAVTLMGGTTLGNNKSLQLVKAGGRVFLVGVGDEVTLLKEFADSDEIDAIEKDIRKPEALFANPALKLPNWKKGNAHGFDQLFEQSLNKQMQKQDEAKRVLMRTKGKEGTLK